MSHKLAKPIEETCPRCGEKYMRTYSQRRQYCPPCGVAAAVQANKEMRERKGPAWEKWGQAARRVSGPALTKERYLD